MESLQLKLNKESSKQSSEPSVSMTKMSIVPVSQDDFLFGAQSAL